MLCNHDWVVDWKEAKETDLPDGRRVIILAEHIRCSDCDAQTSRFKELP